MRRQRTNVWRLTIIWTALVVVGATGPLLVPAEICSNCRAAQPVVLAQAPGSPGPQAGPFGPRPGFGPQFAPQPPGPNGPPGNLGQPPGTGGPPAKEADRTSLGALGGAIVGLLVGLMLYAMLWAAQKAAKSPVRLDPETGGVVVAPTPLAIYLLIGLASFVPLVLLIIVIFMPPADVPNDDGGRVVGAVFAAIFALGGAALVWGVAHAQLIAADDALIARSGWRKPRHVRWGDITKVEAPKNSGLLLFHVAGQKKPIKLSLQLAGLKPLMAKLRERLPADRIAIPSDMLERINGLEEGSAFAFMGQLAGKKRAKSAAKVA